MILSVDFIAQLEAEVLPGAPLQSDVAMISIATPGERAPRLPHFLERLSLEFHDVENDQEPWIAFHDEHATAILEFIARIHTQEKEWRCIIHCKAGISRSAAVAIYVAEATVCQFPRRQEASEANLLVLRVLTEASGLRLARPDGEKQ
ncbi:MAG: hypothetical protein M0Z99_02260 [Betaproteobacteria bacterium]|nr:hypothetical protein [Betaproteobacteria bacterium]